MVHDLALADFALALLPRRNCTRYFIGWDRGTEPVAGAKETRTILDKLRRAHEYFCEPRGLDLPGRHWSQRRSYYLDAFQGDELLRPKVLIITRSAKRAENIWKLAVHFFRETLNEDQLLDFLEVLTVEQASSKLRKVLATAEARERPAEMPWVASCARAAGGDAVGREAPRPRRRRGPRPSGRRGRQQRPRRRRRRSAGSTSRSCAGKWKTHEDVEREQREIEDAERRRQGVLGKLKDLVRAS